MGLKIGPGKMPGYIRRAEKLCRLRAARFHFSLGAGWGHGAVAHLLGLNLMISLEFFGSRYCRKDLLTLS